MRRHLITRHKNNDTIKQLCEDERGGRISKQERVLAFARLKKEGIRKRNQLRVSLPDYSDDLLGERRCDGKKVMCSACHGFFKKEYFYRHRKHCTRSAHVVAVDRVLALESPDGDEWRAVLAGMRQDDILTTVKGDAAIMIIGKDIFEAKKVNKCREAKVKARRAMRRVARLKTALGVLSARELFTIKNITRLETAICEMSRTATSLKAGLKIALGTLVKQCCHILVDHYLTSGQKAIADEIREFREVFASPIHYAKLMATAEYHLKEKRQRQNRKPSNLPSEVDLSKLMSYIDDELKRISTVTSPRDFVQLRKVTLARITLLNARRGSEAARLLVADWYERGEWIRGARLTSKHKELLKMYSVAFVMGKGDKLLPVFFPVKCEEALGLLADSTVRQRAGVSPTNGFLFAYTDASPDGSIGYNDIRDLCMQIGINVITAT